jgi:hypothetical protein
MNCDGWISVKDRLPKTIFQPYSDFEYSENVFAVCDGKLKILCLCYGKFETAEGEQYGYWWANCYGNIFCEHAEWDDDYQPTLWMPLPKLPETEVPTGKLRMWKGMRHKLGELSVRRSLLSKPLDVFEERLYQDLIDALRILDRLKITEEVNRG